MVDIRFVDLGHEASVKVTELREIPPVFLPEAIVIPFQVSQKHGNSIHVPYTVDASQTPPCGEDKYCTEKYFQLHLLVPEICSVELHSDL